mmetsp:Transcript_26231/g.62010  ORF Transcript_26231/g.62010 Transcript_26231/m.62010 type:complete len:504 (-) Transcript_26231:2159-3670(-)
MPAGPSAASWVMGWSSAWMEARPSRPGAAIVSRELADSRPLNWSCAVSPPPSKSSHSRRFSVSASGAGRALPRCSSVSLRVSPGLSRKAGSARQASGISAWRGSTGAGPSGRIRRSSGSARTTQTSSALMPPSGSFSACTDAVSLACSSMCQAPGRACTTSRPSSASRAGSGLSSCIATKPGSSARGSSTARARPATRSSKAVLTVSGRSSSTRRVVFTSRLSLASAGLATARSHSRPSASGRRACEAPPLLTRMAPRPAGTARFCGMPWAQDRRPSTTWLPGGSHTAGCPSASVTASARPAALTSCGQAPASPGRATRAGAPKTCTSRRKLASRGPAASCSRPGQTHSGRSASVGQPSGGWPCCAQGSQSRTAGGRSAGFSGAAGVASTAQALKSRPAAPRRIVWMCIGIVSLLGGDGRRVRAGSASGRCRRCGAQPSSRCWNTSPACSRSAWNLMRGQFSCMARSSPAYSSSTVGALTASQATRWALWSMKRRSSFSPLPG